MQVLLCFIPYFIVIFIIYIPIITIYWTDIKILANKINKLMSLYYEYSRESRTLLRGLSNSYPVTIRENNASTAWSSFESRKRIVLRDLLRIKLTWDNNKNH